MEVIQSNYLLDVRFFFNHSLILFNISNETEPIWLDVGLDRFYPLDVFDWLSNAQPIFIPFIYD